METRSVHSRILPYVSIGDRKVACTDMYGPYPNSGLYTSGHSRILLKVAIAIEPGCVYGIVYCPDTRRGDLRLFD